MKSGNIWLVAEFLEVASPLYSILHLVLLVNLKCPCISVTKVCLICRAHAWGWSMFITHPLAPRYDDIVASRRCRVYMDVMKDKN